MVGPSGSGKSSAWRTLLKALENVEGVEGVAHVVDPKVGLKITRTGYMCVAFVFFTMNGFGWFQTMGSSPKVYQSQCLFAVSHLI